MPHIKLAEELPGIRGPFAFRPETAKPMCELAEVLLHTPGPLSMAEHREMIATTARLHTARLRRTTSAATSNLWTT